MKAFYITTPIYYANDRPHIGHAYTTIAADIMRRWEQVTGRQTFFLTGTDEHGAKIARAAEEAGQEPKEFLDEMVRSFRDLWPNLNAEPDDFIRTTDDRHIKGVQEIFRRIFDKGDIYKGHYEGRYCVPCESYFTETQLTEKRCPDCGRAVEMLKEESYFFRLSKYQDFLLNHYAENPAFLKPSARAPEMVRFVESGLKDLSVSRTRVPWGIPVPFDPEHTVYVWFDALINYVTGAGFGWDEKKFSRLWPADVHLVGKEIFKFHSVIWPAMLKAADIPLPKKIFAHGWWTVEGEKMSKSLGNVIDPEEISREYSVDTLRYFLFREMPFGADGNFTRESFRRRYNSELANDLGNLFSRTVTLVEKYCGGAVPKDISIDGEFRSSVTALIPKIAARYTDIDFYQALIGIWRIVERANQYIDRRAPWKTKDIDRAATEETLGNLLWAIKVLAVLLYPVMPAAACEIWSRLGEKDDPRSAGPGLLKDSSSVSLTPGRPVRKGDALFPRK